MASDNFTNTNGTGLETHDSNWGNATATFVVTTLEIQSNAVVCDANYVDAGARYTTSTEDTCEVVTSGGGANPRVELLLKCDGTNLGYQVQFYVNGGYFDSCSISADAANTVYPNFTNQTTYTSAASRTLKIVRTGTDPHTISVYADGVLEASTTFAGANRVTRSASPGFILSNVQEFPQGQPITSWTDGAAAGGATPHYAFGLPLHGPFAGPIG